jgi:hypothetical protein
MIALLLLAAAAQPGPPVARFRMAHCDKCGTRREVVIQVSPHDRVHCGDYSRAECLRRLHIWVPYRGQPRTGLAYEKPYVSLPAGMRCSTLTDRRSKQQGAVCTMAERDAQ